MKKLLWFALGFALVFLAGGAFLLGCLPNPQASDATPPPAVSTPASTPTAAPAIASLAWRRDAATECSGLRVDDLSQLYLVPCEGEAALMRFSQQELHTYLGYVARYAAFTYHEDPSPENEMAAIDLTFVGRGTREATPEEQAEMSAWAAAVHQRIQAEAQRTEMIATARTLLAAMLNIVPDVITTVAVEQVTWPVACLGLPQPGVACAQVETPGYRIILRVGTDTYTYRTDLRGLVRLAVAEAPTPTATASPTATSTATPTSTVLPTAAPTATPSPTATLTPTATPVPTWTPAPAPTDHWRAEYYTNDQLLGVPAVVAREDSVNRTWGYGGPAGIPADNFSARWTRRIFFEDGKYDFRLEADDGVRLWVGGMLVIDRWSGGHRVDMVSQKHIPQGEHVVVVEYFELEGFAKIELGWQKVFIPPTPAPEPVITDWRGEYYNNVALEGPPALITNEVQVQFEWGEGSPHPAIQRDGFSARYTRRLQFPRGDYRLTAVADDGVRVWIDNRLVIDAWQPGIRRSYTHLVTLDGVHDLRVDYFEQGGAAALAFGWERLSAPSPVPPTPTATVAPPTATPTTPPTATPSPTPTQAAANVWIGEYFANTDLIGTPLVTREERAVAFEWGEGSPHPSLPNDRFSARFSQRVTLTPGIYRLGLVADDGARLYVDGQLVIDEWRATARRHVVADVPLGGEHVIRIEYFENGGAAALYYGLEFLRPTDGTPAPVTPVPTATPTPAALWEAEYYDNTELRGEPEFTRQEEELSFDWREEEPDRRLGKDEFSARYTRTVELPRGTYRLHLVVDDGARVYVDGILVIDQWRSGIRRHVIHDLALGGTHTLVVEYYENKGGAALFFAWEAVGGAALGEGEASENLVTTLNAAREVRGIRPPTRRNR